MEYNFVFGILLLISLFQVLSENKYKEFYLFVFMVVLLLFVGLRDETGTDWIPYKEEFFRADNPHMDIGYKILNSFFRALIYDYNAFVFFISLVYLSIFYFTIRKFRNSTLIMLFFFSTFLIGWMGTNRQLIAIAISLLAGEYYLKNKLKTYYALVLIAVMFHASAMIYILMPFVYKKLSKLTFLGYLWLFLFSLIIGYVGFYILVNLNFMDYILNSLPLSEGLRMSIVLYSSSQFDPSTFTLVGMIIKRLFLLTLLILILYILIPFKLKVPLKEIDTRLSFYTSMYVFSICILAIFQPIMPIFSTRGGTYFYIYSIFLIPLIINKIKNKNNLTVILLLYYIFCFLNLQIQLSYDSELLLPYKSLLYNQDLIRELY